MKIKELQEKLQENSYVEKAVFTHINGLGFKCFDILTFDGVEKKWEIRNNGIYCFDEEADEWEHVVMYFCNECTWQTLGKWRRDINYCHECGHINIFASQSIAKNVLTDGQ